MHHLKYSFCVIFLLFFTVTFLQSKSLDPRLLDFLNQEFIFKREGDKHYREKSIMSCQISILHTSTIICSKISSNSSLHDVSYKGYLTFEGTILAVFKSTYFFIKQLYPSSGHSLSLYLVHKY